MCDTTCLGVWKYMRRNQLPSCASSLFSHIHSWYWRQTVRQTGELKERQAGRQTSSQTGRQTERHTWAQGFRGQLTRSSQLSSHHRRFHYAQLLQTIQRLLFISKPAVCPHTPTIRQHYTSDCFIAWQQHSQLKVQSFSISSVHVWTNIKFWLTQTYQQMSFHCHDNYHISEEWKVCVCVLM